MMRTDESGFLTSALTFRQSLALLVARDVAQAYGHLCRPHTTFTMI
jgi:hypothetical protein